MKKHISLPIMLLALLAGNAQAFLSDCCGGPLKEREWFIRPKIGVAPTIFATHRAHQLVVVPWAGVDTALCNQDVPECNVNNFADVLQETQCLPKFSKMFNQGVLHVGVELGHTVCDRSECFLEFVYNRATGKCFNYCDPFITNRAHAGCSANCDTDCSNDCNPCNKKNDCCPTGDTVSDISASLDNYSNYQAFGGYIGGRHFTNRFWCDSTSFWFGAKVGILHRKRIDSCSETTVNLAECDCVADTIKFPVNRAVFCASNSVSGGVQVGFDYSYNDCLAFELGFEIVASCGLTGNLNHPIDLTKAVCTNDADESSPLLNCARLASNIIVCNTGSVLNFPIWFGVRWEFDCCNMCNTGCN